MNAATSSLGLGTSPARTRHCKYASTPSCSQGLKTSFVTPGDFQPTLPPTYHQGWELYSRTTPERKTNPNTSGHKERNEFTFHELTFGFPESGHLHVRKEAWWRAIMVSGPHPKSKKLLNPKGIVVQKGRKPGCLHSAL